MRDVAGFDVIISSSAASTVEEMDPFEGPVSLVRRGRLGAVPSLTVSALLAVSVLASPATGEGGPSLINQSAFEAVDELNHSVRATHLSSVGQGSMPGSIVSAVAPEEELYDVPDVLAVRVPRRVLATVSLRWRPGTLPRKVPLIHPDSGAWEEDE